MASTPQLQGKILNLSFSPSGISEFPLSFAPPVVAIVSVVDIVDIVAVVAVVAVVDS
jgi:hypothetical protein